MKGWGQGGKSEKAHRRIGNQMAHMVMLPVSCQQDMKLYASWTRCSSKEVHLVPLLPYPVATAGNSPRHNSAGTYLDAAGELEVQSSAQADSENKVSISCKPPVWTVRSQKQAAEWRWKIPVWNKPVCQSLLVLVTDILLLSRGNNNLQT